MTLKPQPSQQVHLLARLWQYQAERFPVVAHGLLIVAFSLSAVCFSALLRGSESWPAFGSIAVAFISAFCFFLQLRLADEFKDFDEDAQFRPYRPVPRGLVSLRELGWLWALTIVLQLGLALWLSPALLPLLLLTWGYLALMSKEFFIRNWLKARPAHYLWSHMLIVPLIDLYTTACDWLAAGASLPHGGLAWFLIASFFNGCVIELGRKIRAPQNEEPGVETYSAAWGLRASVGAWLGALLLTALGAGLAARAIGFAGPMLGLLGVLLLVAMGIALAFLRQPTTSRAGRIELMSGLWTLLMYLGLGVVPLISRLFGLD